MRFLFSSLVNLASGIPFHHITNNRFTSAFFVSETQLSGLNRLLAASELRHEPFCSFLYVSVQASVFSLLLSSFVIIFIILLVDFYVPFRFFKEVDSTRHLFVLHHGSDRTFRRVHNMGHTRYSRFMLFPSSLTWTDPGSWLGAWLVTSDSAFRAPLPLTHCFYFNSR